MGYSPKPSPESLQQSGFTFVQGGLDIIKIDKIPLICSVSYFKFGGYSIVGGSQPHRGDGTATATNPFLDGKKCNV